MAHWTHPQESLCWYQKSNRLIGWIIYPASLFSLYLHTQVNDTTVNLPVSSESGAVERVNDSTMSKPLSDEAEGAVQDRNHCLWRKLWLWIPFKCSLLYLHSGLHCCRRVSDQQISTFLSSVPLQTQHPESMSRENAPTWSQFSERCAPHSCLSLF